MMKRARPTPQHPADPDAGRAAGVSVGAGGAPIVPTDDPAGSDGSAEKFADARKFPPVTFRVNRL